MKITVVFACGLLIFSCHTVKAKRVSAGSHPAPGSPPQDVVAATTPQDQNSEKAARENLEKVKNTLKVADTVSKAMSQTVDNKNNSSTVGGGGDTDDGQSPVTVVLNRHQNGFAILREFLRELGIAEFKAHSGGDQRITFKMRSLSALEFLQKNMSLTLVIESQLSGEKVIQQTYTFILETPDKSSNYEFMKLDSDLNIKGRTTVNLDMSVIETLYTDIFGPHPQAILTGKLTIAEKGDEIEIQGTGLSWFTNKEIYRLKPYYFFVMKDFNQLHQVNLKADVIDVKSKATKGYLVIDDSSLTAENIASKFKFTLETP